MTKINPNPYKGMGIDELREVIKSKNYSGMTIKELRCDNLTLLRKLGRKINGVTPLSIFYEEGLIRRIVRPKDYFKNLAPETAVEMVRENYAGITPTELYRRDVSFSMYIGKTKIGEKTLADILLEEGTLVPGSKSHPKEECLRRSHPKWETATAGYKSFRQYMPHYVNGARH